jgi:hypothetical protein
MDLPLNSCAYKHCISGGIDMFQLTIIYQDPPTLWLMTAADAGNYRTRSCCFILMPCPPRLNPGYFDHLQGECTPC